MSSQFSPPPGFRGGGGVGAIQLNYFTPPKFSPIERILPPWLARLPWHKPAIAILALLCSLRFVQETLEHRQTDLLIGAIIMAGCLIWQRGTHLSDWLAASCWGFAAAMK